MHSNIDGVCANDTVAHNPAAKPWGTYWNFKYSLDSLGPNLNAQFKCTFTKVHRCASVWNSHLDWDLPPSVGFLQYHELLNRGKMEPLNFCG